MSEDLLTGQLSRRFKQIHRIHIAGGVEMVKWGKIQY
jgi:hypothetical protein